MSSDVRVDWPRRWLPLVPVLVLVAWFVAFPATARAHPLDEYLQATYLTVGPARIEVDLELTPGVLVAPQILPALDPDGDQLITDAEARAYVDAAVRDVVLLVDGQPLALVVTKIDVPSYLNVQAGYGTFRVFAEAPFAGAQEGTHSISYKNAYAPTKSSYQVNAFVDRDAPITLGKQNRDAVQQSVTLDVAIGRAGPAAVVRADPLTGAATGVTGQAQQLLAYLDAPALSPWKLLPALALAVLLGGLHALTPGHGKTLVAAYLVGSRGTARDAVALGAIVTFTHTSSVVAIGALALVAGQYVVPGVLVPVLEVLSGVLVVAIGARLVRQRWAAIRRGNAGHDHGHANARDHGHSPDHGDIVHGGFPAEGHARAYTHDHGDGRVHSHLPPAEGVTSRGLVTMGVSGGLIPCPEALAIMIVAVGLNRVGLGLGLIVAFSVGLAAVLMAIGVLLVRARPLVERLGGLGNRWSGGLSLGSAAIVTALGVGIAIQGVLAYLH